MTPQEKVAREFVSAFNRAELDSFVAILDPEVELHSMRGLKRGREEARIWATRAPGGVQQSVTINSAESVGDRVLLEIERHWHWAEDDTHASTEKMAWLFTVRDGLITTWHPYEDRTEARTAFTTP
ncbi:MAG: nuclear transport factor 2 family protein [Solirubrobacterales bacterium]|nr:nuclear transport factor 2 family protein [Solirubrobacterales bacterium]